MADQEIQAAPKQELSPAAGEFTREGVYFSPAVDIFDNERELVVLADMPGVSVEDVEIDLRDNVLSIIGKMKPDGEKGDFLLREYRTGNYFRTFRITEVVDQSRITAAMADGVLRLVLPKVEKAVPRKIPIAAE
ncbi:MAG: Hsp20/alpha crystallin family protein [Desulfomonile tiedjei]|nr:Hsp20/alpha crystallin family protein [Desulfomonile tiedjei]